MATITKHKDPEGWRVAVNGRKTAILITKGPPPKFGAGQSYDVVSDATDSYLFEARSVGHAMGALEYIAAQIEGPA